MQVKFNRRWRKTGKSTRTQYLPGVYEVSDATGQAAIADGAAEAVVADKPAPAKDKAPAKANP